VRARWHRRDPAHYPWRVRLLVTAQRVPKGDRKGKGVSWDQKMPDDVLNHQNPATKRLEMAVVIEAFATLAGSIPDILVLRCSDLAVTYLRMVLVISWWRETRVACMYW